MASNTNLLKFVPAQAAMKAVAPRTIKRMPTVSDLEYQASMSIEKEKTMATDLVVRAAEGKTDSLDFLQIIKTEIAREAASLYCQRIENEKYGKDTAMVSSRRIEALSKIAAIELEIRKLGVGIIDLKGEQFQKVFKHWIVTLQESAAAVLTPEQVDMLFNKLESSLEGWEERATEDTTHSK
jgi:hypothetical protein